MTYGITVINDNSYLQIDSETPRLCAIHRGTYTAVGSRTATITFPSPIVTVEPPCIFIRNSETRPGDLYDAITITGGSGNWTGFTIRAANLDWRPTGKWFAAVFAAAGVSDYGMQIWSASGALIYDTGTVPVVVTKANQTWTYQGKTTFPTLGAGYYFRNEAVGSLLSDEYFMVNPFSRGVLRPGSALWDTSGVRFNYSENRLQLYIITNIPAGPWLDQGQPAAVFARLPGS